jgi:hypothetical protein
VGRETVEEEVREEDFLLEEEDDVAVDDEVDFGFEVVVW